MTTKTRTRHDAFMEAIVASPDDDLPRLAFADWLDEREGGASARAEFIRVQCELTRRWPKADPVEAMTCDMMPPALRDSWPDFERLRRRAKELLIAHALVWADRDMGGVAYASITIGSDNRIVVGVEMGDAAIRFRRGFAEEIECTCRDWLGFGPDVLAAAPTLREVRISDAHDIIYPVDGEPNGRFFFLHHRTPRAIYLLIESDDVPPVRKAIIPAWKRFPSHATAFAALSAACLAYARAELARRQPAEPLLSDHELP